MDTDAQVSEPRARPARLRPATRAVGLLLLAAWSGWIAVSAFSPEFRLLGGAGLWFPAMPMKNGPWPYFGLDFMYNLAGAFTWANDQDPYAGLAFSFAESRFVYPPFVLRLFAWTALFGPRLARAAVLLWMAVLVALGAVTGLAASRQRRALGGAEVAPALLVALFLGSTPFLFALERGNFDMLVLACLLAGAGLLRARSPVADLAAGALFAAAAWMKLYPGLLIVGLFFLGRRRAALAMAAVGVLIGLLDLGQMAGWVAAFRAEYANAGWSFAHHAHSLTRNWPGLFAALHLSGASRVPATLVTVLVALPAVGAVGWRVLRSERREALGPLFLLWLVALGTFVPVGAFDYNLVFLVAALLIAWDVSLPPWLQALFALQLLWLQPFAVPGVPGWVTFWLKVLGVVAVALVLVRRAAERSADRAPTRTA